MKQDYLIEAECKGCGNCLKAPTLEDRMNVVTECLSMDLDQLELTKIISVNYNSGHPSHTSGLFHLKKEKNLNKKTIKIISVAPNSDENKKTQNLVFKSKWINEKNKNALMQEAIILSDFYKKYDTEDASHNSEVEELTLFLNSLLKETLEGKPGKDYNPKYFYELKKEYELQIEHNPFYLSQLATAALLHDIGKIFIPREILHAPRRLNDNEIAITKQHASHGYQILKNLEGFEMAAETALNHHEQWETGNGYHCKKKREIPFYCNLIALADIIQVMTSKRAYKDKSSLEKTIGMIIGTDEGDEKGNFEGYFHPTYVQMITENFDAIQYLINNFK